MRLSHGLLVGYQPHIKFEFSKLILELILRIFIGRSPNYRLMFCNKFDLLDPPVLLWRVDSSMTWSVCTTPPPSPKKMVLPPDPVPCLPCPPAKKEGLVQSCAERDCGDQYVVERGSRAATKPLPIAAAGRGRHRHWREGWQAREKPRIETQGEILLEEWWMVDQKSKLGECNSSAWS